MDVSYVLGNTLQIAGFSLIEVDDDVVDLFHNGTQVASFHQHSTTTEEIRRVAERHWSEEE